MTVSEVQQTVRFGVFQFDPASLALSKSGSVLRLGQQPLQVLAALLERPGEIVSREELRQRLWGADVFVDFDHGLNKSIQKLRDALSDSAGTPLYIETIPRTGYRFIAPITRDATPTTPQPAPAAPETVPAPALPPRRPFALAAAVLAACLILAAAALFFWPRRARLPPPTAEPSLAVLPILNQSDQPAENYIADGMTETLIRQFAGLRGLRVIGSASVARYRSADPDLTAVRDALKVDSIFKGRIRRDATHTTLSVELLNAHDGSILLAHDYLLDENDLSLVQADIVHDTLRAIGSGLPVPLNSELRPHTANPAAYDRFLRGEAQLSGNSPAELHAALASFTSAVTLDPAFDQAWLELAQTHTLLGLYFEPPRDHMPVARDAARRALQLNPALTAAHGTLGIIALMYDWDYATAVSELHSGESRRGAMDVLACTVHLLDQTGNARNAEETLRDALAYNPESALLINELGCVEFYRRHYPQAVQHYTAAMQQDPESPLPYWGLGKSLVQLGRYKEAIDTYQQFGARTGTMPPLLTAESGYAFARWRHQKDALNQIHALTLAAPPGSVDPYFVALIYHGLGDDNATFAWLDKALDFRSPFLISTLSDPRWQDLLANPRFISLTQKMNIKPA